MKDRMGLHTVLHMLRDTHGHSEESLRAARLEAADRLEELQDAYVNMRAWAEANDIDTTARN